MGSTIKEYSPPLFIKHVGYTLFITFTPPRMSVGSIIKENSPPLFNKHEIANTLYCQNHLTIVNKNHLRIQLTQSKHMARISSAKIKVKYGGPQIWTPPSFLLWRGPKNWTARTPPVERQAGFFWLKVQKVVCPSWYLYYLKRPLNALHFIKIWFRMVWRNGMNSIRPIKFEHSNYVNVVSDVHILLVP